MKDLIIRRFKLEDKDDLYNNWTHDENNAKYILFKIHNNEEDKVKGINFFVNNDNAYAIEYKKEVIGCFTYIKNIRHNYCEISYILGNKFHGKGITSYVLNEFIKRAKIKKVNLIIAEVMEDNIALCKLLEKHNFKLDGIIRKKYIDRNNKYQNVKVYTLLLFFFI